MRERLAVGLVPVVGTLQLAVELATGRDYVAGEPVHRGLAAVGIVAGMSPGGKAVLKTGAKAIGEHGPRGGRLHSASAWRR